MTASAKRKKTSYSTHQYTVTTMTPTGNPQASFTLLGSRDAFHKQINTEKEGFMVVVHNQTLDIEEYRSPGCPK